MSAGPLRTFVSIGVIAACGLAGACGTSRDPSAAGPSASSTPAMASVAATSGTEVRYLALGDSFTIGTGSPEEAAFPSRLASILRARGTPVTLRNLGGNGYGTEELLEREVPEIGRFKPTLVTLAIGANDLVNGGSPEHYREQVRRIFAAIDAAGVPHASVLVLPQPDWSRSVVAESLGDRAKIHVAIEQFNDVLREEARRWGARYIELWPLMAKQAEEGWIAPDGLHPSAAAYEVWADTLADALTSP